MAQKNLMVSTEKFVKVLIIVRFTVITNTFKVFKTLNTKLALPALVQWVGCRVAYQRVIRRFDSGSWHMPGL